MTEFEPQRQWPSFLSKKDCSLIIQLRFKKEIKKHYSCEVQALCKTSGFGSIKCNQPKNLD